MVCHAETRLILFWGMWFEPSLMFPHFKGESKVPRIAKASIKDKEHAKRWRNLMKAVRCSQSSACTDGGALLQHTLLKLMCSWAGPLAIISWACCDFRGLVFADSILLLVPYFQNFRMWGCDVGSLHQFVLNHCGWWIPDDTTVITLPLHEEGCTSVA